MNTVMASALAPLTVTCPRCGARRGQYCTSKSAYTTTLHAPRKALLAELSDDDRVAAYTALRAETDATRQMVVDTLRAGVR